MMLKFEEIPYHLWGPYINKWGYVTTIAQFDEDDIILKVSTPHNKRIVKRFTDWERCADEIELIEQDRRF